MKTFSRRQPHPADRLFYKQKSQSETTLLSPHKKALAVLLFLSITAVLSAFPGITSLFPTASGQYVYYRDYTFTEESYIGFLQYDEGTYAIRYYTPVATDGALPIIEMYVTLNTEVDYVDITGEKIASPITQIDTEVMNYMHDMLYEFAARRKKLNDADFFSTVTSNEDFMQFGGDVSITWDFYIPIFNLHSITDENGDVLLEAVTLGALANNNDQSFASFAGFEDVPIIDDYFISSITPARETPALTSAGNGMYAVGSSCVLMKTSTPYTNDALTAAEKAALAEQLKDAAWQIIYPAANSFFSLNLTQYLPYTELEIGGTGVHFKAVCSQNGSDFSEPYYALISYAVNGINLDYSYLLIPVEEYWKNAAFYDSLID